MDLLRSVVKTLLAGAFLWAGVVKLFRPEVFAVTVKAFGLLPEELVGPLSLLLPVLEVGAAAMLFFSVRGGLGLTAGLLLLFLAVVSYALGMGLDVDCGCYGPSDPEREAFGSLRQALWRDGAMLAGVAFLWWRNGAARKALAGISK